MENTSKGEYGLAIVQLVLNRDDLRDVIKEVIDEAIAEQLEKLEARRKAEEEAIAEQHVLADEVGKTTETLSRWAKAGKIIRVPDTRGREVYYYRNQFTREKAALAAKRKMLMQKEVNNG
jgi:arginine repressor